MILTWDHKEPSEYRSKARENIVSQYDTVNIYDLNIRTVRKCETGVFEAVDENNKIWTGRKLVLASGVEDIMPNIGGFRECWGNGMFVFQLPLTSEDSRLMPQPNSFHCFFCKGYEERGSRSCGILAIDALSSLPHAMHVGRHALQLSSSVTFYTNGSGDLAKTLKEALINTPQMDSDNRVIQKVVKGCHGAEVTIHFEDGSEKTESFLGAVPKMRQKAPFAAQLSLDLGPGGEIITKSPFMQTSMKGVFAAGDCGSAMKTATNALSTGTAAGAGISAQILAEKLGHQPLFN